MTATKNELKVRLISEREAELSRVFDAPPDLVFETMMDPQLVPQWWGPRRYKTIVDKMDVRVGGSWRIGNLADDGGEHWFRGEYTEIVPGKRVVQTFEYEPFAGHISTETMTLEDLGDGRTLLRVRAVYPSKEAADAMLADGGMEEGAAETYDRLEELLARRRADRSRVKTFLMFKSGALEAARLYTSLIPRSRITSSTDLGPGPDFGQGPGPRMVIVDFELDGVPYSAMDGGSDFAFSEGMSILVSCDTQQEIDDYTSGLMAGGGEQGPCGWLKDRFGVSWQIVPRVLDLLLADTDRAKAKRVLDAMLKMQKIDIAALERAHAGQGTATPRT